jgi:hypothetical protein
LRRRWSVVYEAAHIRHLAGELCWVPVRATQPSGPTHDGRFSPWLCSRTTK